jgi:hypothetical protein
MDKLGKEKRSTIVNNALDNAGVPNWGRAGIIKSALSVSPATASGWLTGSLPKDPHSLLHFCDKYDLSPHEWVFGEKSAATSAGITEEKIISYVGKIKEFEVASGKTLTPDQFAKLFVLLTRSEDQAKFLLEHADFLLS